MIGICGAGAIGRLWAYRLGAGNCVFLSTRTALAGSKEGQHQSISFDLIDTSEDEGHADTAAINAGFVRPPHFKFPFHSTSNTDVPDNLNAVLICTKSYDSLDAALALDKKLSPSIPFVLCQNGLGSQKRIVETLTSRQVFAASSTAGANINNEGQLVLAGYGETVIGALNKLAESITGQKITILLTGPQKSNKRQPLIFSKDIEPLLWKKLLINCGINAITAIENVPNGDIQKTNTFHELWTELIDELTILAPKANLGSLNTAIEDLILDVAAKTGNNISSMLQDVRANKQTEIADINGYACKVLKEIGAPAYANQELTRRVYALRD